MTRPVEPLDAHALASIVDAAADAIFVNASDGSYEYANAAACTMLGTTMDELRTMRISDVAVAAHADEIEPHLDALSAGEPSRRDWTLRRSDGSTFQAQVYSQRLADGRYLAIVRDVTDERTTERALERRICELECIDEVNELIATDDLDDATLIVGTAEALGRALDPAGGVGVAIHCCELSCRTDVFVERDALERSVEIGTERLRYELAAPGRTGAGAWSEDDVRLADLVCGHLARALDHRHVRRAFDFRREVFRLMVEQSDEAFCVIDPQTHEIVEFNDAACSLLGYSRERFGRLAIHDIQAEMDRDAVAAKMREIVAHQGSLRFATRHRHRNGSIRDMVVSNAVIHVGDRPLIAAVWLDVTEERRQQKELDDQRGVLQRAESLAHVGSWSFDLVHQRLRWSEECYRIFGIEPGREVDQTGFRSRIHPEDRSIVDTAWDELMREGVASARYRIRVDDGVRWVEERAVLIVDANGEPESVSGATHDVTDHVERVRLETEQREALEREVVARTAALRQAVARLERNDRRVSAMLQFEQQAGQMGWRDLLTAASSLARELSDARYVVVETPSPRHLDPGVARVASDEPPALSACDDADRSCCPHIESVTVGDREEDAMTLEAGRSDRAWRDDERTWLQLLAGDLRRTIRRRHAELALVAARERAEQASIAKSRFLANMSHEIRTPLNTILGLTHLIEQRKIDEVQRSSLERINAAGRHLLDIINDILDVSRIEADRLELRESEVDLEALLNDVSALIGPRADQAGLRWIVDIGADVAGRYRTDPLRLRQILVNLAGNAVKFTDTGSIRLSARLDDPLTDPPTVAFVVEDTGRGIAVDDLGRLFRPFEQGDDSSTRQRGGTGLGLTISRRIAELMGGHITVASELGRGTVFTVFIPMRCVARAVPGVTQGLAKRDVLVVEPDLWSRQTIAARLREHGARVHTAASVTDALAQMEAVSADSRAPACVLVGAGSEPIDTLRAHTTGSTTPFVQLAWSETPLPNSGDWDAVLSPPYGAHRLSSILRVALGGRSSGAFAASDAAYDAQLRARYAGARVLVVDDDNEGRTVTLDLLASVGLDGIGAANGADAVARLSSEHVDLVLMDLHMPVMDGVEATRVIRSRPDCADLPIIAVTASAFSDERRRCLDAGMNEHLAKPVAPGDLFRALLQHLPRRRTVGLRVRTRTPFPEPGAGSAADLQTCIEVVRHLAELASRDDTLTASLSIEHSGLLTRTLGDDVKPLLRACRAYDFEAARELARSMLDVYSPPPS